MLIYSSNFQGIPDSSLSFAGGKEEKRENKKILKWDTLLTGLHGAVSAVLHSRPEWSQKHKSTGLYGGILKTMK